MKVFGWNDWLSCAEKREKCVRVLFYFLTLYSWHASPCAAHHPPSLRVQWPPAPDEIHRRFSLRPSAATIGRFGSGLRWCCCSCSFSPSLKNTHTHTHIHFFSYLHTGTDNTHNTYHTHTQTPNFNFALSRQDKRLTHTHTHTQSNRRKFKIVFFLGGGNPVRSILSSETGQTKIISSPSSLCPFYVSFINSWTKVKLPISRPSEIHWQLNHHCHQKKKKKKK